MAARRGEGPEGQRAARRRGEAGREPATATATATATTLREAARQTDAAAARAPKPPPTTAPEATPDARPAPRLYLLHPLLVGPLPAWDAAFADAAALGFDAALLAPPFAPGGAGNLLHPGDPDAPQPILQAPGDAAATLATLADKARAAGLRLFCDLVLDRVAADGALAARDPHWFTADPGGGLPDPRPGAAAPGTLRPRWDARALVEDWETRLACFAAAGVAGFRCDAPARVPVAVWQRLMAAAPVPFLAWTPGGADPAALGGAGFAGGFDSLGWWDLSAGWFVEERARLSALFPVLATVEPPFGPRAAPAWARGRLAAAVGLGAGMLVPMGFEYGARRPLDPVRDRPGDWEWLRRHPAEDRRDALRAATALLAGRRLAPAATRPLTAPGAPVTALRRGDALVLANPDTGRGVSVAGAALLPAAGGARFRPALPATGDALAPGTTLRLAPGEVRVLAADPVPPIRAPALPIADATALSARIAIAAIAPAIDAGRFAVKRSLGEVVMAEVEVRLPGRTERYALPLAGVEDVEGVGPLASQLALSRLRQGRRVGFLTDAFADDRLPAAVLAALRDGAALPTDDGELRFRATSRLAELTLPDRPEVRRLSAEQSNSTLIFGEQVVLKILRKIAPGLHPEAEMTRHLTEAGFASIPPLLGEVLRVAPDGTPHTLLLLQGFVRNQGDGWGWTQDWLHRAVDEAALTDAPPDDVFAGYLGFAGALGRRLGALHAALAAPSDDPAFAPVHATAEDTAACAAGALAQLDPALALLDGRALDGADAEAAALLRNRADALRAAVRRLAEAAPGALATRVHGDFHLGQVLVAQGDAVIVDFEGEPARSLAERRAKGSPLRDVAGLLRSLDYAAAVAGRTEASGAAIAAPTERRLALCARWRAEAGAAFLDAYRGVEAAAPSRWVPEGTEASLLDLFLLEKAAYELRYEAANRPAWIGLPLAGLAALAGRLT